MEPVSMSERVVDPGGGGASSPDSGSEEPELLALAPPGAQVMPR